MKKWCLMVLAALCLLIPTVGSAQGLPDFLQAVQPGLSEGLSAGSAAMEKDLTLSVTASDARVEAGRDVTLTIRAENPRPAETRVALTLSLPERLAAETAVPADVETVTGFTALDRAGLDTLLARLGLAMDWRTCRSSRHTSGTRSAGTPP